MPTRPLPLLGSGAALALGTLFPAACVPASQGDDAHELRIFAASSLAEAFADLESTFERLNPDVDVRTTFAGSQVLRLQLEQGAEADLFASANETHVEALRAAGLVARSVPFARNELVVIVPSEGDGSIESFPDLVNAERLVIGTEHVPIGAYTRRLFDRVEAQMGPSYADRLRRRVVSEESNVRLVRAKVELGEADAAIVYRTDAASPGVRAVAIPDGLNVQARYLLATLERPAARATAERFVAFVLSDEGGRILARHGFLSP